MRPAAAALATAILALTLGPALAAEWGDRGCADATVEANIVEQTYSELPREQGDVLGNVALYVRLKVTRIVKGRLHTGPLAIVAGAETLLNPAYSKTFNLKREPNGTWTIALCALDQSR